MSQSAPSTGFRALRRQHPRATAFALASIALLLVVDGVLAWRWTRYEGETARLRAAMSDAERARTDMIVASEADRVGVMLELIRRQAASDAQLHLSVSVDSGYMRLERDGALLREMRVDVGGERSIGQVGDSLRVVRPRGARTVERVLSAADPWEVPAWVYDDRQQVPPSDRTSKGALGRNAMLLSGGTVIYATPDSGLLADSSYVLPGSIRLSRTDLRAIAPNITPGITVYFY